MSDTADEKNGATPEEPTEEQLKEHIQQVIQQTAQGVFQILEALAPQVTEEDRTKLSWQAAHEQLGVATTEILPSICDPVEVQKRPTLVLTVMKQNPQENEPPAVQMRAPKRLDNVRDVGVAAQHAVLLALVMCPQARALLRAYGFEVQFASSTEAPKGSLIITQ